jgi:hypothetical protein
MKKLACFLIFINVIVCNAQTKDSLNSNELSISVGAGYVFQYYNKIAQPAETGSGIRLDKYNTSLPVLYRLQINYALNTNKYLRLVVSPFNQMGSFTSNTRIVSEDVQFNSGEKVDTYFGFNALRFGFVNRTTEGRFKSFKMGITLVVRKWEVRLMSSAKESTNDNVLALPLLYLGYERKFNSRFGLNAEVDVLGFPFAYVLEGGAELDYQLSKNFKIAVQYRILSGAFNSNEIKNALTAQSIGLSSIIKF